jgi:hypothetical protein
MRRTIRRYRDRPGTRADNTNALPGTEVQILWSTVTDQWSPEPLLLSLGQVRAMFSP